jgi:8-oxo-dGTP diphosphatase
LDEDYKKPAKDEKRERFQRILCGVLAAVEGPDNRVVFVHQKGGPFAGNWLLPGGAIEMGESADEAVIREVLEETGITITEPRLFAIYEIRGDWNQSTYHFMLLAFHSRTEQLIAPDFSGHNVNGVRQVRVGDLPLHSTDLRILTDAGIAQFDEAEIDSSLVRDKIRMKTYKS